MKKLIAANPAAVEDVFFKKGVRKIFKAVVTLGLIYIIWELYTIMRIVFLDSQASLGQAITSLIAYGGVAFVVFLLIWPYYTSSNR